MGRALHRISRPKIIDQCSELAPNCNGSINFTRCHGFINFNLIEKGPASLTLFYIQYSMYLAHQGEMIHL
jgi:hypothetical protein